MGDQLLKNPKFSDFTKKTSFIHQFAKYTDFSPRKWPFSPDEKLQIKKTTFLQYINMTNKKQFYIKLKENIKIMEKQKYNG